MFLGYYINSPAYHNQLKPLMQGIKVTSISKSALQDTDMIMPKSIAEQIKIGEYFSNLDNLITLHQRERMNIESEVQIVQASEKYGLVQRLLCSMGSNLQRGSYP
jgi:type I restriction enzyme S subunit